MTATKVSITFRKTNEQRRGERNWFLLEYWPDIMYKIKTSTFTYPEICVLCVLKWKTISVYMRQMRNSLVNSQSNYCAVYLVLQIDTAEVIVMHYARTRSRKDNIRGTGK